ncbi:MAG: DUF5615 family PIN-like protein [Chloroflexi bacterium]|nr:DUF5615 family PIN-like protein [Chloroflexota bacterium]
MMTEPSSLVARLYFDEDADARLAEALRRRGYDVETTVEAGLLEASDEEQLLFAARQQRALITHNIKHFPGVHATWVEGGQEHWGIIILIGHSAVSAWLRRMENLLHRFSAQELQNQLLFLGAEYDTHP